MIVIISIAALAIVASVVIATYAANMQGQRYRGGHESMSEEECEEEMGRMHQTGDHGSMMNTHHNFMMHGTGTSNRGCPGH